MDYYETKRMLIRNIIIGAIIGVVVGCFFVFALVSPTVNGGAFNYLISQGYSEQESVGGIAATAITLFILSVSWALFMPLGYPALKRVRDRLLSGWFVSCLLMLIIQIIMLGITLSVGGIIGLVYLIYCLVRMAAAKRHDGLIDARRPPLSQNPSRIEAPSASRLLAYRDSSRIETPSVSRLREA